METKNQLPYLPHELIIQILLRLPVKSLICFKCVCKSWFSLFSNPQFTNSQFQLTTATHIHRALFMSTESPRETRSINLETSLYNDIVSVVSLNPNFMPPELYPCIEIKGSCRGFLLLHCVSSYYVFSSFYLWNPSTGLYKQIPFSPPSRMKSDYFYGFGYDHSTNDYFVVSMSSDKNSSYWEFFSLRANTWKQIDDATHIRYSNTTEDDRKAGSLFNGVIHWFAYRHDLEKDIIVAFDLMERKPLDMHLPDQFECELVYCGLWVFQEFLSLWSMNYDNHTIEIWVMKEYKVHSSWTKTHVLPTDAIPTKKFYPLRCTKIGDIVGTDEDTGIVKYNDERQLLGHRSYSNNPCGFLVAVYTESLLSLPGDNVQA